MNFIWYLQNGLLPLSFKDLKYYIMTQLELYKEALRLLRDSEAGHRGHFRVKYLNYGVYCFSGLCRLMTFICDENFLNDEMVDIFKSQSEDILGKELNWKSFWFTSPFLDEELAKQERIEHLENLIKLYEKN